MSKTFAESEAEEIGLLWLGGLGGRTAVTRVPMVPDIVLDILLNKMEVRADYHIVL